MSGQSYPPVSRLNSQAGLASFVPTPVPPRCVAVLDDTSDGGLYHRCCLARGHAGIHHDGHGQMWVDLESGDCDAKRRDDHGTADRCVLTAGHPGYHAWQRESAQSGGSES